MSTAAVTAPRVPRRPRLVGAEFLKLRKRRGLVVSGLALTVLPMLVAYTVLLIVHGVNPVKHGPAGGLRNFSDSMDLLMTLSGIAAILIGATLGAGDLGSGVFRELVVTGRSRLALFGARIPAGLGLAWMLAGAGFAIGCGGCVPGAADQADAAVAEVEQVAGGEVGAEPVVAEGREAGVVGAQCQHVR